MSNLKEQRLKEKLDLRDFKLHALLEVTRAINAQTSEEELMQRYVDALKSNLGIDRLVLYASDLDGTTWDLLVAEGTDANWQAKQPASFFEALDLDSIGLAGALAGDEHPSDVVVPIHQHDEAIAVVLAGDTSENVRGVSPVVKHLNFLVTLTNVLVVARRNRAMVARSLQEEALRRELELAGEMQAMLLPSDWRGLNLDIAGHYQPHTQVGGDYYDAFSTDGGSTVMCMADVSGKGMSAALLMSNFQAQVRALFQAGNQPLEATLRLLNRRVMEIARGEKYITFFVAIHNADSDCFQFVNCGHNPPLYLSHDGHSELLTSGCVGLGMFRDIPSMEVGDVKAVKGGLLCCYTDGLVEQENDHEVPFGTDRLLSLLRHHKGQSLTSVNNAVVAAVEAYRGEVPRLDDTALLSIRFSHPREGLA
ncbi:MAG: SpoIIE family protein phosphatase [Bacteroidetes bacterium]|nr:SpoIIE family protein phosphatase [Bacteroidota bacterium]MDA0902939.1 SpoIIE family protein phosphatase [Bacteroidota bacterium]MDA1241645.1 SpoIIE family protein phosphatase [Bacteroidota bacterium]